MSSVSLPCCSQLAALLAPTGDPHSEQEGDEERLQRSIDGHLTQPLGPAERGILRGRLQRLPARPGGLLIAVDLVLQPGGFGHGRCFLHIHAALLSGVRRICVAASPPASSPPRPSASCPQSASAFPSGRPPPYAASWRPCRPSPARPPARRSAAAPPSGRRRCSPTALLSA